MSGKIIPRSYGSIPHLSISKLNQQADKKVTLGEENMLTVKVKRKGDRVIVTEKVDGSNVGIIKINGEIKSLMRAGYEVKTSEHAFLRKFDNYVEKNRKRFFEMLREGERLCGEWMIKTHSLAYNLPHEPFIGFDIIQNKKRVLYDEFVDRCNKFEVVKTGLVHDGGAISIEDAMAKLGMGFHGCLEQPEGVVYRYESNGKVTFLAKFVRDHKIDGLYMNDLTKYNKYKGNY